MRPLLLFDIDGTLLLCRGRGMRAMHRAIQQLTGAPPIDVRILPQGKTDPILFEEVGAAYGLPAQEIVARTEELQAVYLEALADELRTPQACEAMAGIVPLLDALAARPEVALGIVSGNLQRAAQLKLRAVGLDHYFEDGAFGSDGRRRADLVQLAMTRFGSRRGVDVAPGNVWVIGDTPADVAGGRERGTRTLAVATGAFARAALEECGADRILDSLADTDFVLDLLCRAS